MKKIKDFIAINGSFVLIMFLILLLILLTLSPLLLIVYGLIMDTEEAFNELSVPTPIESKYDLEIINPPIFNLANGYTITCNDISKCSENMIKEIYEKYSPEDYNYTIINPYESLELEPKQGLWSNGNLSSDTIEKSCFNLPDGYILNLEDEASIDTPYFEVCDGVQIKEVRATPSSISKYQNNDLVEFKKY